MITHKRIQDLTIKDNFMFGAVMVDEKKYCYTFDSMCNTQDVLEGLVKFLKYVSVSPGNNTADLQEMILKENQMDVLTSYLIKAVSAKTFEVTIVIFVDISYHFISGNGSFCDIAITIINKLIMETIVADTLS